MIFFRRVVGDSMKPTLRNGQIIWAHEVRSFRPGQVVVAFIDGKEVIKRIETIENGMVHLVGDNKDPKANSTSYRVSDTKIDGVVFWPRVAK